MVKNDGSKENDYSARLSRARELYQTGDYEAASFLYHQLIDEAKNKKKQIAELWVELAWAYFNLKRFESTIICLKQVIDKPQNYERLWDVYRLTGLCHLHLGRLKKAIINFEKSLQLMDITESERRYLLYDLGQVHFQRGEYPAAQKLFEEAKPFFEVEDNNEDLARINYSIGFCHYYLSEYQQALQFFEDAESIADVNQTRALALYGQAYVMLNFMNYEKLIQLVEKISNLDPEFADKESLAYFLCRGYKGMQDRIKFDLFYSELKKNYPDGKYSTYYDDLENW